MKKIKRIKPPKLKVGDVKWNVEFRSCCTGVAVDIERRKATTQLTYDLDRVSYLIPQSQIKAWSSEC